MKSQSKSSQAPQQELKEAIYHLREDVSKESVFAALKLEYGDEGQQIAKKWLTDLGKAIPIEFHEKWEQITCSKYRLEHKESFLKGMIYDRVRKPHQSPIQTVNNQKIKRGKDEETRKLSTTEQAAESPPKKRVAESSQTKSEEKPPKRSSKNEKHIQELIDANVISSGKQTTSYHPNTILNMDGAVYIHPYKRRDELSKGAKKSDSKLRKIVDCEVRVLEATEILREKQGRQADDLEVRYTLKLNGQNNNKAVIAEITYEELTTKTRFSNFLVKHGFIKFLGRAKEFDWFHEFLINTQVYPTIRVLSSWGEFQEGEFIFENGIYSTSENRFIPQNPIGGIPYNGRLWACHSGSEQVQAPTLSKADPHAAYFLAEKFRLWEEFNGDINVRCTLGYAVACVYSEAIIKKLSGFPILFKYGAKGTGKSTSMDWFMALFGYPDGNRQSISKQNTIKGVLRRMALPRSFPFFLDDYRNSDNNSNSPDLTNSFLNWYHRIGTGMAAKTTDHQTIDTPMRACVVMTGNDKPSDSAAVSRVLVLNYNRILRNTLQDRVSEISDYLDRFSMFLYLLLEKYDEVGEAYFRYLAENRKMLANEGFDGRTVNNWSIVLAGIQCLDLFIPFLSDWNEDFDRYRDRISGIIQRQIALQETTTVLHEFFFAMEHYATQKRDLQADRDAATFMLDQRHFRKRDGQVVELDEGQRYEGATLAIHLRRIWSVLEDIHASITRKSNYESIASKLENSSYFLKKSVQVPLTKSMDSWDESNVRCYLLNVDQLAEKGLMDDLLQKASEYEEKRKIQKF